MRSDAKLGLALGMLVIGFAVAFCFPRPGRISHITELRKPTLSVAEPEIEFVQLRSLREERDKLGQANPSQQLNHILHESEQSAVVPTLAGNPDGSSESLTDVSAQTGLSDLLFSDNAASAELTESFTPVLPENMDIAESAPQVTTYQVQARDTLSGIAMKTLGSYSRYLDIYAANRDQLNSPDDLPLGMQLRIPSLVKDEVSLSQGNTDLPKNLPKQEELKSEGHSPQRFRGTQGAPFLSDRRVDFPVHQIQPKRVTTHLVQSGDTLEGIAMRYFGTTRAVQQLRQANPELTRNPQRLRPGVVLQLVP